MTSGTSTARSTTGCAALLAATLALAITATAMAADSLSLFDRLVVALEHRPGPEAGTLASLALARLGEAYEAEARAPFDEDGQARQTISRWQRAVTGYANEIARLKDLVDAGFPVTINAMPQSAPVITVDDYRLILSHPRLELQEAFETGLVEAFCQRENCDELLFHTDTPDGDAAAPSKSRLRPQWEFTPRGPACQDQGIRLTFPLGADIAQSRDLCANLFAEITTLATTLAWHSQHQVVIDWRQLSLSPAQDGHLLKLNALGDTVVVTTPILHGNDTLLQRILPWVQARLAGREMALAIEMGQDGT